MNSAVCFGGGLCCSKFAGGSCLNPEAFSNNNEDILAVPKEVRLFCENLDGLEWVGNYFRPYFTLVGWNWNLSHESKTVHIFTLITLFHAKEAAGIKISSSIQKC